MECSRLQRQSLETVQEKFEGKLEPCEPPGAGWSLVKWQYRRLWQQQFTQVNFDWEVGSYADFATFWTAWNPQNDRERALSYTSTTHNSTSGWFKCQSPIPFVGNIVPYLDLHFHFAGAGHEGRFCNLIRTQDARGQWCYRGWDWRDRPVYMKPVEKYTYLQAEVPGQGTVTLLGDAEPFDAQAVII